VSVLHHNDLNSWRRRLIFELVARSPLAGKIVRQTARAVRSLSRSGGTGQ
jgi:hypothetical protein